VNIHFSIQKETNPMTSRLAGKAALITGAGGGIGREIARRFTEEGARIAAADIDADAARETADALDGAIAIEMDVTSWDSVSMGVRQAANEFGHLDTLVNNAGIAILGEVQGIDEETWDKVMDTSLKSVFLVSKAAWPYLAAAGGTIVNTASIAGLVGMQERTAYCTAKAGVVMITKCMALDGAKVGIRVNCVCPGYTRTPMLERALAAEADPDAVRHATIAQVPSGRLGESIDVAQAFVYLASVEAAYVTGASLVVDGGLTTGIWP
jgi:NAD(P)-dependent dehydrogenase (short-subunit alcohol dehydrogenase family)